MGDPHLSTVPTDPERIEESLPFHAEEAVWRLQGLATLTRAWGDHLERGGSEYPADTLGNVSFTLSRALDDVVTLLDPQEQYRWLGWGSRRARQEGGDHGRR